jgi:type VI secretion system protein ImpM
MDVPGPAGCFGKVRAAGDFVTRRLPREFVEPWDAMLQAGLLASRERLGPRWLAAYLDAPLWCFALAPGVAGSTGWAGVLMPSIDSVGRHFPFTVAAPLDARGFSAWLDEPQPWFDRCAGLALSTLECGATLAALDAGLRSLDRVSAAMSAAQTPPDMSRGGSLWWTRGSETLAPCARACAGLPDAMLAGSFIDGAAQGWPWCGDWGEGGGA